MSHTPHELAEEFPRQVETIHRLREEDAHFRKRADEYHRVNRRIHRAETDVEPLDDAEATRLRRERVRLKDEIAAMLAKT